MKLFLFYVYILTNEYNTVLYTGVTNDLVRRCHKHKDKKVEGFTKRYNVNKLVYFEKFDQIEDAIFREKQLKGFSRSKKNSLITSFNPEWIDLSRNGKIEIASNLKTNK